MKPNIYTKAFAVILIMSAMVISFQLVTKRLAREESSAGTPLREPGGLGAPPKSSLKSAAAPALEQVPAGMPAPKSAGADNGTPAEAAPGQPGGDGSAAPDLPDGVGGVPPAGGPGGAGSSYGGSGAGADAPPQADAPASGRPLSPGSRRDTNKPAASRPGFGQPSNAAGTGKQAAAPGGRPAGTGNASRAAGGKTAQADKDFLDHLPPELRDAVKKAPYLLKQYENAMRELMEAIAGDKAIYQAMLNGDFSKVGGVYTERAKLDTEDKTTYNPGGPCGDYPQNWCKLAPNTVISFGGGSHLNRQCVCYVAWKRWHSGQSIARGDAGDWPGNSQTPAVGSAAIWNRGTVGRYGHIAYVTAVNADSITISEFNWRPFAYSSRNITRGSRSWPSRFMPK